MWLRALLKIQKQLKNKNSNKILLREFVRLYYIENKLDHTALSVLQFWSWHNEIGAKNWIDGTRLKLFLLSGVRLPLSNEKNEQQYIKFCSGNYRLYWIKPRLCGSVVMVANAYSLGPVYMYNLIALNTLSNFPFFAYWRLNSQPHPSRIK